MSKERRISSAYWLREGELVSGSAEDFFPFFDGKKHVTFSEPENLLDIDYSEAPVMWMCYKLQEKLSEMGPVSLTQAQEFVQFSLCG